MNKKRFALVSHYVTFKQDLRTFFVDISVHFMFKKHLVLNKVFQYTLVPRVR
jgi:hypothetical protein